MSANVPGTITAYRMMDAFDDAKPGNMIVTGLPVYTDNPTADTAYKSIYIADQINDGRKLDFQFRARRESVFRGLFDLAQARNR